MVEVNTACADALEGGGWEERRRHGVGKDVPATYHYDQQLGLGDSGWQRSRADTPPSLPRPRSSYARETSALCPPSSCPWRQQPRLGSQPMAIASPAVARALLALFAAAPRSCYYSAGTYSSPLATRTLVLHYHVEPREDGEPAVGISPLQGPSLGAALQESPAPRCTR